MIVVTRKVGCSLRATAAEGHATTCVLRSNLPCPAGWPRAESSWMPRTSMSSLQRWVGHCLQKDWAGLHLAVDNIIAGSGLGLRVRAEASGTGEALGAPGWFTDSPPVPSSPVMWDVWQHWDTWAQIQAWVTGRTSCVSFSFLFGDDFPTWTITGRKQSKLPFPKSVRILAQSIYRVEQLVTSHSLPGENVL